MLEIAEETPLQADVSALFDRSDEHAGRLYPPETLNAADPDDLDAPNVRFFVARLDGRPVGCAALVLRRDGTAELKRVFVDEAARGSGVGRALMETIETAAAAEGVRAIQLETGPRNEEALGLYRSWGYRVRGPFGPHRANPDPLSVFMEKDLRAD